MPNANVGHLPMRPGAEIMPTSMAPLRGTGAGWACLSQILRPNYGFTLSSGYATYLTNPTTAQCQKLLGFSRRGVSQSSINRVIEFATTLHNQASFSLLVLWCSLLRNGGNSLVNIPRFVTLRVG